MISIIFLEILKEICCFKQLSDFSDVYGFGGDELENFMKTDCLQTALIHNKPDKVKKHVLNLMVDRGLTLIETASLCELDNVLPIIRTLTLTAPGDQQRLLDCFLKENKEQQKEFIGELIELHRKGVGGRVKLTENEQYPCPTRAFLAKLGIFNNKKEHQAFFGKNLENRDSQPLPAEI